MSKLWILAIWISYFGGEYVDCFFLFHTQRANKIDHSGYAIDCRTPNVRTVLFRNSMLTRECWNSEELSMLLSRAIMQTVLPRQKPSNMALLFEYFKNCLQTIKYEVKNKRVRIMMTTVMIDVLGGYLQAYGIPIMKRMYYEGFVEFDVVSDFHKLQNNFKTILATDGGGWAMPMFIPRKWRFSNITTLNLFNHNEDGACEKLVTYSNDREVENYEHTPEDIYIPMPKLDDPKCPSAIAIPLRSHALMSLDSKYSYDVLLDYYTNSMQCLMSISNGSVEKINEFQYEFHGWIKRNVMPRVQDEKWYPGFFGIYRILATIQIRGSPLNHAHYPNLDFINTGNAVASPEIENDEENEMRIENECLQANADNSLKEESREREENLKLKNDFNATTKSKKIMDYKHISMIYDSGLNNVAFIIGNNQSYALILQKNTLVTLTAITVLLLVICIIIYVLCFCRETPKAAKQHDRCSKKLSKMDSHPSNCQEMIKSFAEDTNITRYTSCNTSQFSLLSQIHGPMFH